MAKYRIKAYFMHEREEAAARQAVDSSVITGAEWTPGYVMGVVDEAQIAYLKRRGLIVTPIEKLDPSRIRGVPDFPRTLALRHAGFSATAVASMSMRDVFPVHAQISGAIDAERLRSLPVTKRAYRPHDKILSCDRRRPEFYIVRFHGPLTRARFNELREIRVVLLERLTRNKYTVRLKPSDLKALVALPSVDTVRLYTEVDTLRTPLSSMKTRILPAQRAREVRMRRTTTYTVRPHRAEDMRVLMNWLAKRGRKPLWRGKDALRVALLQHGKEVLDLARLPEVATVEELQVVRSLDPYARALLGLQKANEPQIGLEGVGEIIGIADTGLDTSHPDFQGRLHAITSWGRPGDYSDPEGHGTHVAGCALGDGSASGGQVMGAAPKARLFFQSILDNNGGLGGLPDDLSDLFKEAYMKGVRVHNNSWGAFAFARYTTTSLQIDSFVSSHPDMLIVIAAGNDGIGVPRASGARMNADNGFVDWPCVASPATAKNGLTIGASRSSRGKGGYAELRWGDAWEDLYPIAPISKERISGRDQCLAAFSSRGPSDDQRIKPDVVAPGTDIAAARSRDAPLRKFWGAYPHNDKYGFMGGTSMAAPYASGCAALVRQWYRDHGGWKTPSAALLKATIINGAMRITGRDAIAKLVGEPNFHQGFGRVDMPSTIPNPIRPDLRLVFEDTWKAPGRAFADSGDRFRYQVTVGPKMPLRICLAWTDPPARSLQNSLVLLVDDGARCKWVGNASAATMLPVAGAFVDPNNNVQTVRVAPPRPGTYTIAITASMILRPPQEFALVVTGDLKSSLQRLT